MVAGQDKSLSIAVEFTSGSSIFLNNKKTWCSSIALRFVVEVLVQSSLQNDPELMFSCIAGIPGLWNGESKRAVRPAKADDPEPTDRIYVVYRIGSDSVGTLARTHTGLADTWDGDGRYWMGSESDR